jgi:hypothetical protein
MEKLFQITLDAKALWGSEIVCYICGNPYPWATEDCCLGDNGITITGFAWEYHLKQLAGLSEKEKFKYVSRFLDLL